MRLTTILGSILIVVAACTSAASHPVLLGFKAHDPATSKPAPYEAEQDVAIWTKLGDGTFNASAYVTLYGHQDVSKANGWISSDAGDIKLCYQFPDYPRPPITDPNESYAAIAYLILIEYQINGLDEAPENSTISNKCGPN